MLSLGALSFASPWALVALIGVPALWWLLRVSPPAPVRIMFPPLRLLARLAAREETAVRTPWWLLVLRLALAIFLIVGISRPLWNAETALSGSGPVFILVDDGWSSANGWAERQAALTHIIDRAERERREVVLLPTAPAAAAALSDEPAPLPPAKAREIASAMQPKPWATDRIAAVTQLLRSAHAARWPPGSVFWITDGLEQPQGEESLSALLAHVQRLGQTTLVVAPALDMPLLLKPSAPGPGGIGWLLVRAAAAGEAEFAIRLVGEDGALLGRQSVRFASGHTRAQATLDLPTELASRLVRVDVEGIESAGTLFLVDERWQRRAVGIVGQPAARGQPLLGADYYLERALQPFAEIRRGDVASLLARPLSMLVLADVGRPDPATTDAIQRWVEQGGVLLRFAGPRLAREAQVDDPLLPVALRAGDRAIGGALSWTDAGKLAPFDSSSPFHGLSAPSDLRFSRQVIAEPSLDDAERTWARLEDGTPLVTGVRRGEGWVVLVHVTASPDWSNLPLSGLFVDMLKRVIDLARGASGRADASTLAPLATADGFGRLGTPPVGARGISADDLDRTKVDAHHPPGLYGTPEVKRALNLGPTVAEPVGIGPLPEAVRTSMLGERDERDLRPWLLGAALLLALADLAASLALRGLLPVPPLTRGRRGSGVALVLVLSATLGSSARGQATVADGTANPASLTTRLAYVRSGDLKLDEISRAGLIGLSTVVNRRTAAELGAPVGIDPETDELAFYPLLYWPLGNSSGPLSPQAARKLVAYMRTGGTIVFDTRGGRNGEQNSAPRELARALDLPPLVPVPEDHVLRRAYYLLSDLPGRRSGGTVWIEPATANANDGVSSVVAGSNDWAGAWAVDDAQRPVFAMVPGGERQREQAYRFGVNLVMYVLTGNYKSDQVHLSTILERLAP